jgi:hypothetical protein
MSKILLKVFLFLQVFLSYSVAEEMFVRKYSLASVLYEEPNEENFIGEPFHEQNASMRKTAFELYLSYYGW